MPFFLATASPSFSALTTWCGLAGATGATNAVLPESIISGRSRQRMIYHKRIEGCSVQKSSCPSVAQAVLWLYGRESVRLVSYTASLCAQILRHALVRTHQAQIASLARASLYHCCTGSCLVPPHAHKPLISTCLSEPAGRAQRIHDKAHYQSSSTPPQRAHDTRRAPWAQTRTPSRAAATASTSASTIICGPSRRSVTRLRTAPVRATERSNHGPRNCNGATSGRTPPSAS